MTQDPSITEEFPLEQKSVDLLKQVVVAFQLDGYGDAPEGAPTCDDIVSDYAGMPVPVGKLLPIIAAGLHDGLGLDGIAVQNVDHNTGSGGVDFYRCIWRTDLGKKHPFVSKGPGWKPHDRYANYVPSAAPMPVIVASAETLDPLDAGVGIPPRSKVTWRK